MPKKRVLKKNDGSGYTVTEVGAMLESIESQLRLVAENHSGLDKRLERVEVEIHGSSRRVEMLEITFRILSDKVTHLDDAVSKLGKDLRKEITDLRQELKTDIAEVLQELKKDIHDLGDRLTAVEVKN